MISLKIKLDDITDALTTRFDMIEGGFYLDTETGGILLSTEGVDEDDLPHDMQTHLITDVTRASDK